MTLEGLVPGPRMGKATSSALSKSTSRRERMSTEHPNSLNPQITVWNGEQIERDPLDCRGYQETF